MAGSDEWRCAAATLPPGHSATVRLERAARAVNAFVVNELFTEDGRALPLTLDGDTLVVWRPR
jgi:hypothetical protein